MCYNADMPTKKLYRSRANVLVAGVCAGLAEYFRSDPLLWRLGFLAFFLSTGLMPGLLLYVIAWIVVPVSPLSGYKPASGPKADD